MAYDSIVFYSTGQLVFGLDAIILIKHTVDWKLILQKKKMQINKDNIHKISKIADHYYKVRDKFMFANNSSFKYKTPNNRLC